MRKTAEPCVPALLRPTGTYRLDDPSDLTCKDGTGQHPMDDPLLSWKQQSTPDIRRCLKRAIARQLFKLLERHGRSEAEIARLP